MIKALFATFGLMVIFCVNAVGGQIEGRLWPVTTPGTLTHVVPVGETRSRIWGASERLRECAFDHIVWYWGIPFKHARADLILEEATKVRGDGAFTFGPWLVQLTPTQLTERSYAIVYHRCHLFWLTETRFFG